MQNKKGVTLVELLLVLSVFIVVSMIVFPLFIETMRLQGDITVGIQGLQYEQRWQNFSRNFYNNVRFFSDPVMEINDDQLIISEEELHIVLQWKPEKAVIELEISPDFYKSPLVHRYEFSSDTTLSWKYQEPYLIVSILSGDIEDELRVKFYE